MAIRNFCSFDRFEIKKECKLHEIRRNFYWGHFSGILVVLLYSNLWCDAFIFITTLVVSAAVDVWNLWISGQNIWFLGRSIVRLLVSWVLKIQDLQCWVSIVMPLGCSADLARANSCSRLRSSFQVLAMEVSGADWYYCCSVLHSNYCRFLHKLVKKLAYNYILVFFVETLIMVACDWIQIIWPIGLVSV